MINTNISILCLLSVSLVTTVERYKYRLLTPSPSPTRTQAQRQYQPRISRQLDIREGSGPYLNKESFFSAGFLEDLFGLGKPADPTVSFQGKREITPGSHPPHFPSFFAPVRSPPSPAFVPSSPYQPNLYHNHRQSPPPVQQYHHTPPPVKITRNDNKPQTPYKYTVKGSSTHYVDNNKKKTPKLHPVQPSHGQFTPRLGSSFLQSSGQDYPGQPVEVSAEQHKVKPFRHHGGLKQQHQPRPALFSGLTPQNVIAPSNKPSMEELLKNIDQYQTPTTPRLPGTLSNDVRSFQNFDVTPSNVIQEHQHHHQSQPKKDVFQIFQKVAEKFSLVKDINQNVDEINSLETTTIPVLFTETDPSIFSENPRGTTDHPDITSAGLFADDSPGNLRNVVIQADKKNAKSFSSVSTATSSSGLISRATTRKSESSAINKRRITERLVETESAVRSPGRRRKPHKPSRNSVTASFSSFPYRDKSSKYNAKQMVKDEGQEPRSPSELVSLEDKQGRKEETLKKLLAIAGEDWPTKSEGEIPVRQRQREKFECPEPEGHFPDPGQCNVYYRCVHDRPTRLMCGAGLLWNTETGQCDWEDEVMCESLSRRPRTTA